MLGYKVTKMPIEPNTKLQATKLDIVAKREQYERLVEIWIYLSHTVQI